MSTKALKPKIIIAPTGEFSRNWGKRFTPIKNNPTKKTATIIYFTFIL
jgi:hypothetical protein